MQVLGIDVGGSGIKGAIVDREKGCFVGERLRIDTPSPATPDQLTAVVAELVEYFSWKGPVGCGFPAVIHSGVVRTAANISPEWVGVHAEQLFSQATGCPFRVLNDADAAGLAELHYGAARGKTGSVMMLTLGTGIGSALFVDGVLFPNTELGHLNIGGITAEHYASGAVRKREGLDWEEWGSRLNRVLDAFHRLWWPDCFIIGGGVSKKHRKFFPYLHTQAELVPAELFNRAGIVGAATAAQL